MTNYKYQEQFARELAESWINGNHSHVRTMIRNLKNKAQAAYIAVRVHSDLINHYECSGSAENFENFMHPNNR